MPNKHTGTVVAHGEDYFGTIGVPITAKRVLSGGKKVLSHPHDLTEIEHEHDFNELVIVLRGMAHHCLGGDHFPVRAGDVFVLQGWQRHYFYDREDLELINVMYDPRRLDLPEHQLRKMSGYCAMFLLEPTFRGQHRFASRLHLDQARLARVEKLAGDIEVEAEGREPGFEVALTSRLLDLLLYLARNYSLTESTEARSLIRIGRVIGALESNYDKNWKVEDLFRMAHMSRSQFMRVFKKATAQSPMEYLAHQRMRKAMELLRTTDRSITDIALGIGYNDSNYFIRQFRNFHRTTPLAYRKLNT